VCTTRASLLVASLLHARVARPPCALATDERATPWKLQQQPDQQQEPAAEESDVPAGAYENALRLLRVADRTGRWPSTSRAREKVLRVEDNTTGGSFALRNMDGATSRGTRGNMEFPELSRAIFDLEQAIAPDRPASTMVAVTRRALFLPHVNNGAGCEPSATSLVVGLGNYTGGALVVEGEQHNIRYTPLAFDGWQRRHWTLPFEGEMFVLEWFTPADKEGGKPYGATLDPRYMSGKVRFSIPGYDDDEER